MLHAVLALLAQVETRSGPLPVASTEGHRVDDLFFLISGLTAVSFLIVLVMLIAALLRFRARPGHKAQYDHGSSLHDKRFTAITSVIVFLVLDASVLLISVKDLREAAWNIPTEGDIARVQVLGQQWAWNFRQPGADEEFGTADDIVTINEVTLPADRPVVLNLQSKDVIHSFFVPEMRVKRDLNPGAINVLWFQAKEAGVYSLLCAELCGFAHYQMSGTVRVLEQDDWDAWHEEASAMARFAHDDTDSEARWAWAWQEQ